MMTMIASRSAESVALTPRGGLDHSPATADLSEAQLLARLQIGDEGAYEVLLRRYAGAMLAIARRILRSEHEARDAVQDACLQAFRSIHGFRGEARLSTWLHRIVANAALMRLRSAGRRPEVSIDDLLPTFEEDGHQAGDVQALPVSPEAALESAEARAQVRECLEDFPAQYRAVIVLRDLNELSTAETAAALGITENAVKIRLHRAHQALRTLLIRRLGEGE